MSADYDLLFRLYINDVKFLVINDILANFRFGGVSTTKKQIMYENDISILNKYKYMCPIPERVEKAINIKEKKKKFYSANKIMLQDALNISMEDIYIFGYGYWGRELFKRLKENGIKVAAIFDNNSKNWGCKTEELEITNPALLKGIKGKVIISMWNNTEEVIEQLKVINQHLEWMTLEQLMDSL